MLDACYVIMADGIRRGGDNLKIFREPKTNELFVADSHCHGWPLTMNRCKSHQKEITQLEDGETIHRCGWTTSNTGHGYPLTTSSSCIVFFNALTNTRM